MLIAGGSNSSGPLASAETLQSDHQHRQRGWKPQRGAHARYRVAAARFRWHRADRRRPDATGSDLDTAEHFDPTPHTFTTLSAQMITARSGHIGLTLPYNGKVLIAGGTSAGAAGHRQRTLRSGRRSVCRQRADERCAGRVRGQFLCVPAVGQVLMSGGLDSTGTPLALTEMFSYPTIRTDKPTIRRARL